MNDFFTSLFSRFTSENTSYGSPQQIEPEPTEENDSAAETKADITEMIAVEEPASLKTEQPKAPKPKSTLPGLMYPDDVKALTDKYGVLSSGMTIDLGLHDALELMPRRRKRCEAYQGLQSYLKREFGVELRVISPRDKNKGSVVGPGSKSSANNKN